MTETAPTATPSTAFNRPLMLLSHPNGGSTWFSNCIDDANDGVSLYRKEFFNPILNQKHYAVLAPHLGSELYPCVSNISKGLSPEIVKDLVADSWEKEPYNFTKEIYLAFCGEHFANHFLMLGLVRDIKYTFPPLRIRVASWYVSCYWSVILSGKVVDATMSEFLSSTCNTMQRQSVVGFQFIRWGMEMSFERIGCEVFDFDWLLTATPDMLATALEKVGSPLIDPELTASKIISTRTPPADPLLKPYAADWKDALDYHRDFMAAFNSPFTL
jgi:hypothetical protein